LAAEALTNYIYCGSEGSKGVVRKKGNIEHAVVPNIAA
jgi:hypothetical protein